MAEKSEDALAIERWNSIAGRGQHHLYNSNGSMSCFDHEFRHIGTLQAYEIAQAEAAAVRLLQAKRGAAE